MDVVVPLLPVALVPGDGAGVGVVPVVALEVVLLVVVDVGGGGGVVKLVPGVVLLVLLLPVVSPSLPPPTAT